MRSVPPPLSSALRELIDAHVTCLHDILSRTESPSDGLALNTAALVIEWLASMTLPVEKPSPDEPAVVVTGAGDEPAAAPPVVPLSMELGRLEVEPGDMVKCMQAPESGRFTVGKTYRVGPDGSVVADDGTATRKTTITRFIVIASAADLPNPSGEDERYVAAFIGSMKCWQGLSGALSLHRGYGSLLTSVEEARTYSRSDLAGLPSGIVPIRVADLPEDVQQAMREREREREASP